MKAKRITSTIIVCSLAMAGPLQAADWPMWRYSAGRGNVSPHELSGQLHLQWVRQLPPARPAWPKTQKRLQFDAVPQPVVAGQRVFAPSSSTDSISAYATDSGKELWRFYAEGPIRFAPVAYKKKLYFVSDDGHLYCVNDADGKLVWKLNGGPRQRWIIGNHRLVSSWPARGGPVLHQGRIYFSASIWPFMGIFIHAVDPESGKIVWTNSGDGTNLTTQPHGAPSFATAAPQGHFAATGDYLIVPGGRSTPAVYDVNTGKLLHFGFDGRNGGHHVMAGKHAYFLGDQSYLVADGKRAGNENPIMIGPKNLFSIKSSKLKAESIHGILKDVVKRDRRGRKIKIKSLTRRQLYQLQLSGTVGDVWMRAGRHLYNGGKGKIVAFDLMKIDNGKLEPIWRASIDESVHHLLAADDRLFIVTNNAKFYCFGAKRTTALVHERNEKPLPPAGKQWVEKIRALINEDSTGGWIVAIGVGSGQLIDGLLRQTKAHVVVVDPDAKKIAALRSKMTTAGLYGGRISAHVGSPATFAFPPYLASVIVSEQPSAFGFSNNKALLKNLFRALRPYGGCIALELSDKKHKKLTTLSKSLRLPSASIDRGGGYSRLLRNSALAGAGAWTHQYGNAGQTGVSKDKLVKAPLGLLWFGGPSHEKILPRHGHGPSPQVAGGRLFIEGPDMLRAMDVYTGRVLWEKELKNFGKYYNTTRHFPGAGEIGSNYVSLPDKVYAVYGNAILELDAATGNLVREFKLQAEPGQAPPNWGHIGVWQDYLIATSAPVPVKITNSTSKKLSGILKGARFVVKKHARWRYLAGRDPKADWTQIGFNAEGWKSGRAGFGYGDGDDKTVLKMRGKFQRVYVRHDFERKRIAAAEALGLMIKFDDAFIAYLNGTEVVRAGVRRGRGPKATGIKSHEAKGYDLFFIKNWKKLLRPGKNVLAIEGHNASLTSGDFSLDPFLIAIGKQAVVKKPATPKKSAPLPTGRYASASRKLIVFNRKTGKLLWSRAARFNFRHNNIAAGNGMIFCVDGITEARRTALARRGVKLQGKPTLYAFDARTGKIAWSYQQDVFGTFLSYSENHDIVLQAGSKYRDRARDEINKGMIAFRGVDGKVLWRDRKLSYGGPCLLWRDKILTNGSGGFALDILSGKKTGWKYQRKYGCNTAVGSEYLLTFRSGCAGFFDLANNSGTGNLGGFRSSCTNNLIVADGVLSAPDYTRTCTCAYQNQTSLALIHMPDAEFWTFGGIGKDGRIGVNLGAPGDRRDANGTLWQAKSKIAMQPKAPRVFRIHSSLVQGQEPRWVASSGLIGVNRLVLKTAKGKKYKVKLYFLEPETTKAGLRVFDVRLQGKRVLERFDVVQQAKGRRRGVMREFSLVANAASLPIELQSRTRLPPILSGVELVED